MRISDWSSDVCSSDLAKQLERLSRVLHALARRDDAELSGTIVDQHPVDAVGPHEFLDQWPAETLGHDPRLHPAEMGRQIAKAVGGRGPPFAHHGPIVRPWPPDSPPLPAPLLSPFPPAP